MHIYCACVRACDYIYMCVCMYLCVRACVRVIICMCVYVFVCAGVRVTMHVYICVYWCVRACVRVCGPYMCVHSVYTHTHIYIYIYIYIVRPKQPPFKPQCPNTTYSAQKPNTPSREPTLSHAKTQNTPQNHHAQTPNHLTQARPSTKHPHSIPKHNPSNPMHAFNNNTCVCFIYIYIT